MQKLTFTIDLTPIELRGMSATLFGMADQIERNLGAGEPEFLGEFFDGVQVFSDTPLTSQQAMMLPADVLEKHTGRIITNVDEDALNTSGNTEQTAADAFAENVIDTSKTEVATLPDVDLDADGIPWDVRIHGASKTKLARGNTWKLKRGVDKDLVAEVIAELKTLMSAPAATTAAPDNVTNITDAKPATPSGPGGPAAPATPDVEIKYVTNDGEWTRAQLLKVMYTDEQIDALPIAGQTVETTETTFPELMQLITPALAANTITDEQITAACVKNGIASINLIASRPDLIPAVKTELFG